MLPHRLPLANFGSAGPSNTLANAQTDLSPEFQMGVHFNYGNAQPAPQFPGSTETSMLHMNAASQEAFCGSSFSNGHASGFDAVPAVLPQHQNHNDHPSHFSSHPTPQYRDDYFPYLENCDFNQFPSNQYHQVRRPLTW
jgi:hypothetical protein